MSELIPIFILTFLLNSISADAILPSSGDLWLLHEICFFTNLNFFFFLKSDFILFFKSKEEKTVGISAKLLMHPLFLSYTQNFLGMLLTAAISASLLRTCEGNAPGLIPGFLLVTFLRCCRGLYKLSHVLSSQVVQLFYHQGDCWNVGYIAPKVVHRRLFLALKCSRSNTDLLLYLWGLAFCENLAIFTLTSLSSYCIKK